jgi:hypothetical protein
MRKRLASRHENKLCDLNVDTLTGSLYVTLHGSEDDLFSQHPVVSQTNNKVRFPSTQQYDYGVQSIDIQTEIFIIATCFGLQATIIRQ